MSSFDVTKHTLTTTPEIIIPVQGNRKAVTLRVPSNFHTVFMSDDEVTCNPEDGYQLTGDSLRIEVNQSPVWARGLTGGEIVRAVTEFTD